MTDARWTAEGQAARVADFVYRTGRSTVTVLLRVLADRAEDGQLVGHAEVVDTGEVVAVHGADDVIALAMRLATRVGRP